jgi:hypothetical protein
MKPAALTLLACAALLACNVLEGPSDRSSDRALLGPLDEVEPPNGGQNEPPHYADNEGDVFGASPDAGAVVVGEGDVGQGATGKPDAAAPSSACNAQSFAPASQLSTLEAVLGDTPHDTVRIGSTVALDGDTLVVAELRDSTQVSSGKVHVYVRSGESWLQQAELAPEPGTPDAWFGETLALSGDTLVIGAPEEFFGTPVPGRVHVYERHQGQWSRETTLVSEASSERDNFGRLIALSGNTLAIVAQSGEQSRIEAFVRGESGWQHAQTLHPVPHVTVEGLSWWIGALALDGETLAASVLPGVQQPGQHVKVFERSAGQWQQTAELVGDRPGELFGSSIALKGSRMVVGDPYLGSATAVTLDRIGGAYVFDRSCDGSWEQYALLLPSAEAVSGDFGRDVRLDGSRIVVTSPTDHSHASGIDGAFGARDFDDDYTGAVYVFGPTSTGFEQLDFVKSTAGVLREKYFGSGIAASEGRIAVGSRGEDKAYVFR